MQVQAAGQTFTLNEGSKSGADGYYVSATGAKNQGVDYKGSPTVITFDPPIGPIEGADAGKLYQDAKAQIEAQYPGAKDILP